MILAPMTAVLADGNGGFLRFASAIAPGCAADPGALRAWLRDLDPAPADWQVIFVSFEGGAALHDPQPAPPLDAPWAAAWTCAPPQAAEAPPPAPRLEQVGLPERDDYRARFRRVREAILDGRIYELNLTCRIHGRATGDPGPDKPMPGASALSPPWSAQLETPGFRIWSRSPECFLLGDLSLRQVETRPIKGTAGPDGNLEALRSNPKERAEHVMIVDMARNDLGRVCEAGSVELAELMRGLDLPYARHLESRVRGRLRPGTGLGALLAATLPAASISGTPKREALRQIRAIEAGPRGAYTGILGWRAPDGRFALSVLIRTAWSAAGPAIHYGSGGGIVADSDPDAEYAELLQKLLALAPSGTKADADPSC